MNTIFPPTLKVFEASLFFLFAGQTQSLLLLNNKIREPSLLGGGGVNIARTVLSRQTEKSATGERQNINEREA
jgi:hypothetical protein